MSIHVIVSLSKLIPEVDMLCMEDSTSGLSVAIDNPEEVRQVVMNRRPRGTAFFELAIATCNGNSFHLEDILANTERTLVQQRDGSWQLDGVTLKPVDTPVFPDMVRTLPHRRLAFLLEDNDEQIAVISSQSRLASWKLQAHVGAMDGLLISSGRPTTVQRKEQERGNDRKILLNIGTSDFCLIDPQGLLSHCQATRGENFIIGTDTCELVAPHQLESLYPHHYRWNWVGEDAITVLGSVLVS